MNSDKYFWRWWVRRFSYLFVAVLVCVCTLCILLVHASSSPQGYGAGWTAPQAMTLKRISDLPGAKHESHIFDNIDCTELTYRESSRSDMQTGCFTRSEFGMIDDDEQEIIFNGTDEGLPVLPYSHNQLLVGWPGANALISLSPVVTGGMRLGIYKNPLSVLHDNRELFEVVSKSILVAPEPIEDPAGEALDINPQTLAFSHNGEWLVAETLNGSFVRVGFSTLDVLPFAQSYGTANSSQLLESRVAISEDGRFAALSNQDASDFRILDLGDCTGYSSSHGSLPPMNCAYFNYWPYVKNQVSGMKSVRHVRFLNSELIEFEVVTSSNTSQLGVYELAADSIGPLINYLGMGDSYTSGEGAFDYASGTDTVDNKCHLSVLSYPFLVADSLPGGGHSVACSGAVIRDVGSTAQSYRGQARDVQQMATVLSNYMPGYVTQQRFVANYQPAIASVSIGGNDIGFGAMVGRCVAPHASLDSDANTCYKTYEDRLEVLKLIDRTELKLIDLFKQLQAEAPSMRLYAIGYPQVVDKNGSCGLNVQLNRSELEFTEGMVNYLNNSIEQAAKKAGAIYIDIGQALYGHRLCEGPDVAINGLTAGNDTGPVGHESFHPNALGHELIARAIVDKTHNFTSDTTGPYPQNDISQLLQAPVTGRPINILSPVTGMTSASLQAGSYAELSLHSLEAGLKPNTIYQLKLDGAVLGTARTSSADMLHASIGIPPGTSAGNHSIDVVGENENGESINVSQAVYVSAPRNGSGTAASNISVKINTISVAG